MSGTVSILRPRHHLGCRWLAYALALLGWSRSAAAAEHVFIDCSPLAAEQAAEVEARVRASLLSAGIEGTVRVRCEDRRARVEVESSDGNAALEVMTHEA